MLAVLWENAIPPCSENNYLRYVALVVCAFAIRYNPFAKMIVLLILIFLVIESTFDPRINSVYGVISNGIIANHLRLFYGERINSSRVARN